MNRVFQPILSYLKRLTTYHPLVVLIELLLIGLFVWWVVRFLRGTRGARLVKGAAVVLATVYVALRLLPAGLGWDRLEFLYGKFLLFVFVASVVAFQPELRRALIQIGQARLFGAFRGEVDRTVDCLVESATYLSRNKIGAVVAIERSVGLGAMTETATPIDAEVTTSLLNTIFYPGSALHDMGVLIRRGRIAAAGVQFPLAESDEVDPSLGSRHRAALGLTKDSDAVVVVVSEETGRVSVAVGGQIHVGLDADALREMLRSTLLSHGASRRERRQASKIIKSS